MPNYHDLANQKMPSLAEILARARARRKADRDLNPGDRPPDRLGQQQTVHVEGEAPFQAQPVQPGQRGRPDVSIGPVSQPIMRLPGVRIEVPPQQGGPVAQGPDQRRGMVRALMDQGLSLREAMERVAAGG